MLEGVLFLFGYYNDDIVINTKTISMRMKSFLNYFVSKMILPNIYVNVAICYVDILFCTLF